MTRLLLALLLVVPLSACSSDGGSASMLPDAGPLCGPILAQVTASLARSQSCKVDADCVHPKTTCGLPEACGLGYANKDWQTPELIQLINQWVGDACADPHCACPAIASAPPACNAGTCGPRQTGGLVGASCVTDGDCQSRQCLTEAQDTRYVGGACTVKGCDQTGITCPAGSECKGQGQIDGKTVAICVSKCEVMLGTNVCRAGYLCCSGPGPLRTMGWCSPENSPLCLGV